MKVAVYPGTFDPITLGHLDVIERALKLFDKLIVAVTTAQNKKPLFSLKERASMASEAVRGKGNVEVRTFDCLLVDFLRSQKAGIILRGLREVSDFEHEFQQAIMNRKLDPGIETVFIMTSAKYFYLTSSAVKEVAALGGDVGCFVPKVVEKKLRERLEKPKKPN